VLKKTITYEDFNGDTVNEDFFFHLSKAELVELELSHRGGLSEALKRIVASEDGKAIIAEFKNIILGSYGKRSDDGRRFIKTQELRDEFESSEAYSTLFMELVTDAGAAADFINGIIPANMAEEAAKLARMEGTSPEQLTLAVVPEPKLVTRAEVNAMTAEEMAELGPRIIAGEIKIED
jgi:hypothetical protein